LEAVGLAAKSPKSGRLYDRFKGRVMFPIRDTQNRPIACGGRILPTLADERAAKYINSPETRLFSKSDQLYGLDRVRDVISRTRNVVVMEGYTDVVVAQQMGVDDCVAVLGTALGSRHIRLLRRFVDSITLVLDGDEAGQRRTNEILELFVAEQVNLRILTLPDGLDPCDYVLDHGAEAFRTLLEGAVDALDHKVRIATSGIDLQHDTHRANQALEDILATLAKAPRLETGTESSMRLREQQILGRLSRDFQIDEVAVRTRLTELRRKASAAPVQYREREPEAPTERPRVKFTARDRELLEMFTQCPDAVPLAMESISVNEISEGVARVFFNVFCETVGEGHRAEFSRVLGRIDDPWLKNLLVEIDEQAAAKAVEKWEAQLTDLLKSFQLFSEDAGRRNVVAKLQGRQTDNTEDLDTLLQMRQQIRKRQGISEPTDG
jgi:DNA primase